MTAVALHEVPGGRLAAERGPAMDLVHNITGAGAVLCALALIALIVCPVTGKSARRVAADLRGPDWMAKVRRRVVMENWPAGRYDGDLRQ